MRIENEILLDYSDVLIRPKRSTLGSRKEVNLEREYTFRNKLAVDLGIYYMEVSAYNDPSSVYNAFVSLLTSINNVQAIIPVANDTSSRIIAKNTRMCCCPVS